MNAKNKLAVLALLSAVPACGNLSDIPVQVQKIAYTPNGQVVVFTEVGVKVYDGDLAHETTSIRIESGYDLGPGSESLSTNGQVASVTFDSGESLLYAIPGGQLLQTIRPTFDGTSAQYGALSPDGSMVFNYGAAGLVATRPIEVNGVVHNDPMEGPGTMYRASDGAQLWSVQYPDVPPYDPSSGPQENHCPFGSHDNGPLFAPDGTTMYLPRQDDLYAVDMLTGVARVLLNARACISGMTFLSDGSLLVHRGFAMPQPSFGFTTVPADEAQADSFGIYRPDGTAVRDIPAFASYLTDGTMWVDETALACAPDDSVCAMAAQERGLDPQTGMPRTGNPETGEGTFATMGGAFVLVWRLDGTLLYRIPTGSRARSVAFSPDGSRLAVVASDQGSHGARVYNVADGTLLAERHYTAGVF